MHASTEELLLLLKKWESESKRVIATGVVQPEIGFSSAFRVSGLVKVDEPAATFSVGDMEGDFALCHISYLGVGYSIGSDIDWGESQRVWINPEEVEEVVVLRNPDSSSLAIYCLG